MAKKHPSTSGSCASLRSDLETYILGRITTCLNVVPDNCDPRSTTFTREGYLVGSLLSKLPKSVNTPEARAKAALDDFLASDLRNARSNERLLWCEGYIHGVPVSAIFERARVICLGILTKVDADPDYTAIALCGSFSGGASTSKKRGASTAYFKFRDKSDITERAMPYLVRLCEETRLSEILTSTETLARVVPGNIFFTAPKNAETDRGACKEPDWNMFFQKGIGDYIRACLLRVGCDLNDQTINQRLALEGSLTGKIATLDLKSASNSNGISLVERVVPASLYRVLEDLRSPATLLPSGEYYEPHMFSSMGNGFTFELESLIFLSLLRAITSLFRIKGRVNVYGDDIIAPVEAVPMIKDLFGYCGHRLNVDKSFYTGPFRESCGRHYLNGVDVTPVYVRKPLDSSLTTFIHRKNRRGGAFTVKVPDRRRVIHLHNRLLKWGSIDGIVDPRLDEVILELRGMIPMEFWGGRDLESIDSAVTPHAPNLRYVESYDKTDVSDEVVYLMNLMGDRTESALTNEGLAYCDIATRKERKLPVSRVTKGPGLLTSVKPRLHARPDRSWHAKQSTVIEIPRLVSEV